MSMIKKLIPIVVFFMISGCASIHNGEVISGSVMVQSGNFQYVKTNVIGTSSEVTYVFGIGGNKTESLIQEAKTNLIANHPLGPNQALANLSVGYKTTFYFGIVLKRYCVITADIIEFKASKL